MITTDRHRSAVLTALEYCRIWGVSWKDSIIPKRENGKIIGFYILNPDKDTTVATVMI